MRTRTEIEAELRRDNPTSGGLAAGDPDYELLITKWTDARVAQFASQASVVVTFRSLAFTLQEMGLYEQVKAAALSSTEGEIWWNTVQSSTVPRDHPFVAALGESLDQTTEQLDVIFAAALKLPQD